MEPLFAGFWIEVGDWEFRLFSLPDSLISQLSLDLCYGGGPCRFFIIAN